jgi:hypothetical protein
MSLEKDIVDKALDRAMSIIVASLKSNDVSYLKNLGGGADSEVPLETVAQHIICDKMKGSIVFDGSVEHVREYNRARIYGNLSHIINNNLTADNFISILKEVNFK